MFCNLYTEKNSNFRKNALPLFVCSSCPDSNVLPLPNAKINLKAKQPDVTSSRED